MARPSTNPATQHIPYDKLPDHVLGKLPPHLRPPEPPSAGPSLYFRGSLDGLGAELLRLAPGSDQPQVIEVAPGYAFGGGPTELTVVGGDLYFAAYDPSSGRELYRLDADGSAPDLIDLRPEMLGPPGMQYPASSEPQDLFAWGDTLYFSAVTGGVGERQLYRLDPGADAPVRIDVGVGGLFAPDFTVFQGALYFRGSLDGLGAELLRLAPGSDQPQVVEVAPGYAFGGGPTELTVVGGDLYFAAYDPSSGRELYRLADGSAPKLIDLRPEMLGPPGMQYPASSEPQDLFAWGDTLYFSAVTGGVGERQLYRLDLGADAPVRIDVGVGGLFAPDFTVFQGALYFRGSLDGLGAELLRLAPGSDQPQVVEVAPGYAFGGGPTELTVVGGDLYFAAYDPSSGRELYRLDADGSAPDLIDLRPEMLGPPGMQYPASSEPQDLFAWGDTLYFSAVTGGVGERQLYRLDPGADAPVRIDVGVGGLFAPDFVVV